VFWVYAAIVVSIASFFLAGYLYQWVKRQPGGSKEAEEIAQLIRNGASAFLRREYKVLAVFAGVVALLILLFLPTPIWKSDFLANLKMALAFLFGATLSGLAGKIGMDIATIANLKSAVASKKGLSPAFGVAFKGGAVMGMAVVGCSLFGASVLYLLTKDANTVLAFSFGASTLALFAKAGGGIYTKTADVSADLVGKVELGIPEDDPRNPAVIADNVGDNVGDVAGMGADLFDSNIASIAAAMVVGLALGQQHLVFCYTTLGLLASILGVLFISVSKHKDPGRSLNMGTYITTALYAVLTLVVSLICKYDLRIWGATIVGLVVAVIIGITSDYFTGDDKKPVDKVAKASSTGPAFTILSGFSYGLVSCFPALLGIGFSALVSYKLCEPMGASYAMFGISMAAIGMLSIVGMIISNDAFGPIVDNARGLVEMANMGEEALVVSDELDSAGNTAKAITKGFAIGAAGLTVIALLGAYRETVMSIAPDMDLTFNIMDPLVFFGIMVGVAVPAVFSAMLMLGVDRNAERMVAEIHRQFETIPGLKEGKKGVRPEYEKCIDIATIGAIKELIPAGLMAIVVTLVVGFVGGVKAIGGYLTGNIVSGLFLALLMANAGGLWDNSKKYIETGVYGGKGSDAHKAAVIGDTVGDPFKDTAGPSLNTQVTVVSLISSLAANLFIALSLF